MNKKLLVKIILNIFMFLILYYFLEFLGIFLFLCIYCFSTNINPYFLDTSLINSNRFMIDSFSCFISIFVFLLIYNKKNYSETYYNNISFKNIIGYVLITMGIGGVSNLWLLFNNKKLPFIQNSLENYSLTSTALHNESYIFILFSVIIFVPIVEELLFRGLIFNELAKYRNGFFPIIISSVLFGLLHREYINIINATILGVILGFIYSKTHSMIIVISMHILNNLIITLPKTFLITKLIYFIDIFQIVCIIPMIYLLYRLYKRTDIPS